MAYAPAPVIVPHPVYIPTGTHHGGGGDVPMWAVLTYAAIALVVWLVVAVAANVLGRTIDIVDGVIGGFLAAVAWPLSIVAGLVYLLVTYATDRIDEWLMSRGH